MCWRATHRAERARGPQLGRLDAVLHRAGLSHGAGARDSGQYEIMHQLVGTHIDLLPSWVASWSRIDPGLISVRDINADSVLQFNEITLGGDMIMLASAEIAGLPYVISGLVAAGALAAALSTADGLLLTMANAVSHDLYFKIVDPGASTARRVTLTKVVLLVMALIAAYIAASKPANILFLVSAAFSIAASAFFPALVLGIFWRRTTGAAAVAGMVSGLGLTTLCYIATHQPWLRALAGLGRPGCALVGRRAHFGGRLRGAAGFRRHPAAELDHARPTLRSRRWSIACAARPEPVVRALAASRRFGI